MECTSLDDPSQEFESLSSIADTSEGIVPTRNLKCVIVISRVGCSKAKKALKLALQEYALKENFEIRMTRSSTVRYEVGCKDPECKFQFRVVKMEGGNDWIVQKFEEEHSCTIDDLHNRHRQASAWLIGDILSSKLAVSGRSLKPKEIMTDMQLECGLSLLYTKALRAKGLAEQNVFGSLIFHISCCLHTATN
ncbi:hypothetical protein Ddye_004706 [Dipteronia dyeriana]|uniref:Transposase MuDR plant domain-containing protein n=1 Tax=Dipteronia dyeriana TaxID=168575 RepID=A0AAD9XF10_9ROSI|nr:hypothetical protein Ddye_004706 [Dipteronia dyeriana]